MSRLTNRFLLRNRFYEFDEMEVKSEKRFGSGERIRETSDCLKKYLVTGTIDVVKLSTVDSGRDTLHNCRSLINFFRLEAGTYQRR